MNTASHTLRELINKATTILTQARVDSPRLSAEVLMAHCLDMDSDDLRVILITEPQKSLSTQQIETFIQLCEQRATGIPVAYLTGIKEFFGLNFAVTSDTLIPRPDTELLVELALETARQISQTSGQITKTRPPADKTDGLNAMETMGIMGIMDGMDTMANQTTTPSFRFADLGTGTGCIAICLALHLANSRTNERMTTVTAPLEAPALGISPRTPTNSHANSNINNNTGLPTGMLPLVTSTPSATPMSSPTDTPPNRPTQAPSSWHGTACDISEKALAVARSNGRRHKISSLDFIQASFHFLPLAAQSLHLIVSNPPYISSEHYATLDHEVRAFEPQSALIPGTFIYGEHCCRQSTQQSAQQFVQQSTQQSAQQFVQQFVQHTYLPTPEASYQISHQVHHRAPRQAPHQASDQAPWQASGQPTCLSTGLEDFWAIIQEAERLLVPNGYLLMEMGFDQGTALSAYLNQRHWQGVTVHKDLAGHDRVIKACWPGPAS